MKVTATALTGVCVIEPDVWRDRRGLFVEMWHDVRYQQYGIPTTFVQDNASFSTHGVLRGLHYQYPHGQGKLVTVLSGAVFDVAVDIRFGSVTFGQWVGYHLSEENGRQIYVPPGFAHGFLVVSEAALVVYKCTDHYHPESEGTILWNDPDIGITWPISAPQLSDKDCGGRPIRTLGRDQLPPNP